jgi:hypothetical protein
MSNATEHLFFQNPSGLEVSPFTKSGQGPLSFWGSTFCKGIYIYIYIFWDGLLYKLYSLVLDKIIAMRESLPCCQVHYVIFFIFFLFLLR